MRRAYLAPVLLLLLALAACTPVGQSLVAPDPGKGGVTDSAATRGSEGFAVGRMGPVGAAAPPNAMPAPLALDRDRAVIVTASVALRATDPWAISDRAQAVALGVGGTVAGLSQSGSGDSRTANLTLRVPSARFNDTLQRLRSLDAEVLASNIDTKDVTDQFADFQARLTAKQSEEQRYLALLARADKIEDILKIDAALSQVRTQVEQLTGQINSIRSRTEMSTITMSITTSALAPVTAWDPARTVERALAALAGIARGAVDAAIWLAFLGTLPATIALAALLVTRRRLAV